MSEDGDFRNFMTHNYNTFLPANLSARINISAIFKKNICQNICQEAGKVVVWKTNRYMACHLLGLLRHPARMAKMAVKLVLNNIMTKE